MRFIAVTLATFITFAPSLMAQQQPDRDAFAAAIDNVRQALTGAPPLAVTGALPFPCYADLSRNLRICGGPQGVHFRELPADAIVVAQRTIGGAPTGYRAFVKRWFGSVIAEDLSQSYGDVGPVPKAIDQETVGGFAVLPVEQFEQGPFSYDWQRLNQEYPGVRWIVRLSWPAIDRLGTYAVVRYELIGRDRPPSATGPWQWASFVKFEKESDQSWKAGIAEVGNIWK